MSKGDVKVKFSGLGNAKPVGVNITYSVGSVPVAQVELAPGGSAELANDSSFLVNTDDKKRTEMTVEVSVSSYQGTGGGQTTRGLKFTGLFDGLSISNTVGGNNYSAVLKGLSQTLLELMVYTPGVNPSGVNPYKVASFISELSGDGQPSDARVSVYNLLAESGLLQQTKLNPVQLYLELLIGCLEQQRNPGSYVGKLATVEGELLTSILKSKNYQDALNRGIRILRGIDIRAVQGGFMDKATPKVVGALGESLQMGPDSVLENLLSFLGELGCTLVFGNYGASVVPVNSVITPDSDNPGKQQVNIKTNFASPADYSSFSFNDNGYRDIGHVLVMSPVSPGSTKIDDLGFDPTLVATYSATDKSKATGVLTVKSHPWMCLAQPPSEVGQTETRRDLDKNTVSACRDSTAEGDKKKVTGEEEAAKQAAHDKYKAEVKSILKAFAETRFYQERFADRQGAISLDFNPNWVPGTSGVLFVRETNLRLAFYVTSVTHRVEVGASQGSATTTVNFCCGRLGQNPQGVARDGFLGYDKGKEQQVQKSFIEDTTK